MSETPSGPGTPPATPDAAPQGAPDGDEVVQAAPGGIRIVDTLTAGMPRVTAGFLLEAPRPALIECGPALGVETVVEALRAIGMDPGDLAYLVVSHIHLDHAGGAGDIIRAFPGATVVVSEVGARHLVDPTRLNDSSRRVYGELFDTVYGGCTPIEADHVRGVADGEILDLGGGRRLQLLYTPGHAKHHIAAFDSDTGALFVGDSVGVRMPGMTALRPATPPPDFDLVLAQRTLDRYLDLDPRTVYLAHYADVGPPRSVLEEAKERLGLWADTAESAYREHRELDHVAETLAHRFADEIATDADDPYVRDRVDLLSGFESNAAGFVRYFDLREQGRTAT